MLRQCKGREGGRNDVFRSVNREEEGAGGGGGGGRGRDNDIHDGNGRRQ